MRVLSLSTATSCIALLAVPSAFAGSAFAQDAAPAVQSTTETQSPVEATTTPSEQQDETQPTTLAAEPESPDNTVTVTGSRIKRNDFKTPNPVISIGSETIETAGTTNLTDFLTGYPALQGSSTSADNSGSGAGIGATGLNLLNLRNLGTDRTLVLVDGRRHVAGVPGSQAIDINTIPSDLVERVDILTGGASAIYGADGVTGVVNFVMKRDFEGVTAHAQFGISKYGDAAQKSASVTAGQNFADGRGNVAIAYEFGKEDRLQTRDRKRLRGENAVGFYLNPDDPENFGGYDGPADNGIPDYVPLNNIRYFDTNREGGIDVNFDGFPDYFVGPRGVLTAFDPGTFVPDFYQQGGNATLVSDYGNDLLPDNKRHVFNALGHFDITDKISVFAEGKYARVKSFSLGQPSFDYYVLVPGDNPYLPTELAGEDVLVNRDNFDFGQRGELIERNTFRGVFGARGDINDHSNFEVSYVYGRSKVKNKYIGNTITDRFYAAVDAVDDGSGNITCRINVDPTAFPYQPYNYTRGEYDADPTDGVFTPVTFQPGSCVPINLFGEGAPSREALDFITATTIDRSKIQQQVLSASLAGDFGQLFNFQSGESLGFALGAEYRKEKSSFIPDPLAAQGLTFTNSLSVDAGKFDVKEAFAELRAPLLRHSRFGDALEVGAAIRLSDYSTIGHTKTWKIDGAYAPIRDIRFVGTLSQAVRAPNIGELFAGQSQTFNFITDPCNINQLQNGTEFRADNCAAILTALGADPATYRDTRSTNIPGFQGGNRNLNEETARTWTAGAIVQPRFLPGLTFRADWYNIKLKGAINTVAAEQVAELCVDQATIDNVFCDSIVRQGSTGGGTADPGNIISFTVQPENVARFRTSGLDVNANYSLRTENLGRFSLNVIGNYLKRLEFIGTPGAPPTDSRGQPGAPKYTVNSDLTWSKGPLTLNYGINYFSKTGRFSNQSLASNPDIVDDRYKYYKSHFQHDVYVKVSAMKKFEVYAGINNLFDQKPDIGTNTYPVSSIGRFFYTGVRFNLGEQAR